MDTALEGSSERSDSGTAHAFPRDDGIRIPIGVFSTPLGALEAVTKYLRENCGLRLCEIAPLLRRDQRTIWGAYRSSAAKHPAPFATAQDSAAIDEGLAIPLSIFSDRSYGMLECVVAYLRENTTLSLTSIAAIINRDYSTVWTTCSRAAHKRRSPWRNTTTP